MEHLWKNDVDGRFELSQRYLVRGERPSLDILLHLADELLLAQLEGKGGDTALIAVCHNNFPELLRYQDIAAPDVVPAEHRAGEERQLRLTARGLVGEVVLELAPETMLRGP